MNYLIFIALILLPYSSSQDICSSISDNDKFDCHPDAGASKENCEARKCCWQQVKKVGVPLCFYSSNPPSYEIVSISMTNYGYTGLLKLKEESPWPHAITNLALDIWFEDANHLRFKIYDAHKPRYEVPVDIAAPSGSTDYNADYELKFFSSPFALQVIRKNTEAILFDTHIASAPFIFSDQFIQISSRLSSELVYGLGEHRTSLLKNASIWQRHVLWNSDQAPSDEVPLYGSHPFYLNIESDNKAHGVFLLNSNAMDVDLLPSPAVTFRTIGGILDFTIFTGSSPVQVIQQYTKVLGRSPMPPFWSLGFHLCRWGYNNDTNLKNVIDRNRAIGIPYDVQWGDIDYMDQKKDFTLDEVNYKNLPNIVNDLHHHTQKYIIILDPAISSEHAGSYSTYDEGINMDVFIKDNSGNIAIGRVWPGSTAFPDFTHPNATNWWSQEIKNFHKILPFDSLWIDMNEPSNFVDGTDIGCLSNNTYDHPPYVPGQLPLFKKTLCPSDRQHLSNHYNLHNLYGLTEANATRIALNKLYGNKKSIIISRSSFPTEGRVGGHWTGDVDSSWLDLYYSVSNILEFQFFGISLVGADVCGFRDDTTEELCIRWMQLGAFYPFMRNHNDFGRKDQDPAAFSPAAQQIMKNALNLRYSLLPYMYTQFFYNNRTGRGVVQPLFFGFPDDKNTYAIDRQFTWYENILVSPVLDEGQTTVKAYLPKALWYDFLGNMINSPGKWYDLDAPLDTINVHVRGGSVIPIILPSVTTTLMRSNPFALFVTLNEEKSAEGDLYWDDGESIDSFERPSYDLIHFICSKNTFNSIVLKDSYKPESGLPVNVVLLYGVDNKPTQVTLNGASANFNYVPEYKFLSVDTQNITMLEPFRIIWN